jgi:hypothetical protein
VGTEQRFAGFLEWAFADGLASPRPGGFAEEILAGGDGAALEADEPFIALASIIIAGLDTTVHMIGNGIAALAEPGEILVSQTMRDALVGSSIEWTSRGVHHLKGVPDEWRTYALAN